MRTNQIQSWEPISFANFVEDLDYEGSKYGITVSGNDPENLIFSVSDSDFDGEFTPTLTYTVELDSDGEEQYMYFMPILNIPELNSADMQFADSMGYYLKNYAELGKYFRWMIEHPYSVQRYTYDPDL